VSEGVRLEDCSGNVLGFLPTDEREEEGEGEGEGDGNSKNRIYRSNKVAMGGIQGCDTHQVLESTGPSSELAQLLEECRVFHDQS
jgi:hypothetical protein